MNKQHDYDFMDNFNEYTTEFEGRELGLELNVSMTKDKRKVVTVSNLSDATREYVIPGSIVVSINDREVHDMSLADVEEIIQTEQLPLRLIFKKAWKDVSTNNFPLLLGDENWLVLGQHVSKKKQRKRDTEWQQLLANVHCRHCPKKGTIFEKVHNLFEDETSSPTAKAVITFVMTLIFISTAAYVVETIPYFAKRNTAFKYIETFVSICFTIEYLSRICASKNAWAYFWDPLNMIDFLAVIPFWIEITFGSEGGATLRVIRVVRLARVFRLMKSPNFRDYLDIFTKALANSARSAGLILTILALQIIVFASVLYEVERGKEDEYGDYVRNDGEPSPFVSILSAAWWTVVTMTTVGYGDSFPIEDVGQLITVFIVFGLLSIALPVIIVGGNFDRVYSKYRRGKQLQHRAELNKTYAEDEKNIEHFLEKINKQIHVACGGQDVFYNFFTPDDMCNFVEDGFDTEAKIINLLQRGK
eukprot:UN32981